MRLRRNHRGHVRGCHLSKDCEREDSNPYGLMPTRT